MGTPSLSSYGREKRVNRWHFIEAFSREGAPGTRMAVLLTAAAYNLASFYDEPGTASETYRWPAAHRKHQRPRKR